MTTEQTKVGATVIVRARPKNYKAVIEIEDYDRLVVRPLPDQGVTLRARAIWRKAVVKDQTDAECSQC